MNKIDPLERIFRSPTQYIEKKSLRLLAAFFDGYIARFFIEGIHPRDSDLPDMPAFSEWLEPKTARSAFTIIELRNQTDECAFDNCIEAYAQFQSAQPRKDASIIDFPREDSGSIDRSTMISELGFVETLPGPSLDSVRAYLDGDALACSDIYPNKLIFPDMDKFTQWLQRFDSPKNGLLRWDRFIRCGCRYQERLAIGLFRAQWAAYCRALPSQAAR